MGEEAILGIVVYKDGEVWDFIKSGELDEIAAKYGKDKIKEISAALNRIQRAFIEKYEEIKKGK